MSHWRTDYIVLVLNITAPNVLETPGDRASTDMVLTLFAKMNREKKWHVELKVMLTGNDTVIQWKAREASLLFSHVISHAYTLFYHLKITWREWLAPVYLTKSTTQLLKTWRLEAPGHWQQWYLPGYLGIFRVKRYSLLCHELPWHNTNWIIICRRYQSVELLRAQLLFCLWLYW